MGEGTDRVWEHLSGPDLAAPGTLRRADEESVQIVVPVYNEGEHILAFARELEDEHVPFDSLKFIFDSDDDTTIPFLHQLRQGDPRVVPEKNQYGRGVIHALRWGFARCEPGPVIVMMGDCSDKLSIVPEMLELWRGGATIVSPSRYMPGGIQHGGGLVKSWLSRLAGVSLKRMGFPTADPTNNFKLYDGKWLREQSIESKGGFEVALELCYRGLRGGRRIVELPTEWRDRTTGESHFKVAAWLPHYLKWYLLSVRELLFRTGRRGA